MREMTIGVIVKGRPVYVVQQGDSVLDAARYMTEYEVGAVPVLDEGDVVGIISERDVMTRVVAQELELVSTKVGDVMTRKAVVLGEDCTCQYALAIMEQLHIRHLPVMAGKQLTGCVSIRQLRELEVESRDIEFEFLADHIEKMKEAG
jgi:CBS domain-containing protein